MRDLDVRVEPGVTAMLAAAASVGAPLGGDFCAISLSDNLKSWSTIERRLKAAAEADFVIALYNAASKARPHQLDHAFDFLRTLKGGETVTLFVRAAGTAESKVTITTLAEANARGADMRTLIIVGASSTRLVDRPGGVRRGSTRRGRRSRECGIEPAQRLRRVADGVKGGFVRPLDHHDGQAECARRFDLAVGCGTSRVFRNDNFGTVPGQEPCLSRGIERTAVVNEVDAGRQRDIARMVDDARDVAVLRGSGKGWEVPAVRSREKRCAGKAQALRLRLPEFGPESTGLLPAASTLGGSL